MAIVATAMYSHNFGTADLNQSSSISNSSTSSQSHPIQPQEEQPGEEAFNTCFCRALYDYDAQDASALSFRRDDIIEVLTKQPSGWWDGLLGEERGWFPSNYVTIISEEEAEQYFAQAEFSAADSQSTAQAISEEPVDMPHALASGSQSENEEWLSNEVGLRAASQESPRATRTAGQPSDFWIPDVTMDGQIYYVNTITGQRSRDLPSEAEEDVSDGDLTGFTSQTTSRSGTSVGLAFGASDAESGPEDTPGKQIASSLWVKQVANDGVSHFYLNTLDGRVQWTAPEGFTPSLPGPSHSASTFPSALSRQPDTSRLSVYSDDSDVQPFDHLPPARARQNGKSRHVPAASMTRSERNAAVAMQLTSAERIAKALQHALEPPPPNLLTDLSAIARSTISTVIDNVRVLAQQTDGDINMDQLIQDVVLAIRNLLYISAHTPSQLQYPPGRDGRGSTSAQSPLKPAQRKVTATLSRLVLSARAMQYDSGSQLGDTLTRIETDSQELERAVLAFVLEVQRAEHNSPDSDSKPQKRLHGVFPTANIGLGLVGAGTAGAWKGFGYVSLDESDMPKKALNTEYVAEIGADLDTLHDVISALHRCLRSTNDNTVQQIRSQVQHLITEITAFLALVADVNVARHVDVDGVQDTGDPAINEHYMQYVENARYLVRTLETVVQAIYDDSSALFTTSQSLPENERGSVRGEKEAAYDLLDSLATALNSNLALVKQTFEGLLSVGHEQADVSQGEYNGSIERRMSRLSVINDQFGGALRAPFSVNDSDHEDFVDVGDMYEAITRPDLRKKKSAATSSYDPYPRHTPSTSYDSYAGPSKASQSSLDNTLVAQSTTDVPADGDAETIFDFEPPKPAARPSGSNKLKQLLGDDYADKMADKMREDTQPWFLRPNYDASEIVIEADGSVRGGTVAALVERLTAHEQADTTFSKAFLMTYKSFTTLDELVDLLIERFRIQPPENLTPQEREQWGKLKQHIIQMRVINTFKSMITDEDVLEKEDLYILDRIKDFVSSDEVSRFAAAKQLNILIERARNGPESLKSLVSTTLGPPPPPIVPKSNKKLKLLDIEPLELARQLTIFESQLYQKIKPIECLQRSREQRTENNDNITIVIQTSNRIADWVAECVLSREDSRRRAQIVRHLISVADRCRTLNNFSTMIAITSGLNTPPIRRLKRTWEQVNQRFLAQFAACELTIDSNKNFTKYRQLMASVTPPCVPFIGVFLSTLQFIQDGNPDNLPGGLVNFRKRQKASEVISDIKRWQAQPFNLQTVPPIFNYITESLNQFSDTKASSEHFWALSLEREPREREDEKMARLLQESGFL